MIRAALALLSSLQLGAQIKTTVERSLRQAGIIAVAALLIIAAAVFGLIAAYDVLVGRFGLGPTHASALLAAVLLIIGLLVLAIATQIGKKPKRAPPSRLAALGEGPGLVDQGLGRAVREIGPIPLLISAFLAGVLAGRR